MCKNKYREKMMLRHVSNISNQFTPNVSAAMFPIVYPGLSQTDKIDRQNTTKSIHDGINKVFLQSVYFKKQYTYSM
jgi:hypothetical protein